MRYLDSVTNQEKLATHVVFDEAHYTSISCPPEAKLLYDVGMPPDPAQTCCDDHPKITTALYPALSTKLFLKPLSLERGALLPLAEFTSQ